MLDTSGCSSLRRLGFQTNAQGLKIHILTIWSWHMSAHVVGSSFFSPFNREHGNTDTHGLPTIPSWPLDGEKSPAFGMGKEYCEVINHGKRKSSKNGGVRGNSTINGCLFVHCHVWPLEGSRVVPLPPKKNRGKKTQDTNCHWRVLPSHSAGCQKKMWMKPAMSFTWTQNPPHGWTRWLKKPRHDICSHSGKRVSLRHKSFQEIGPWGFTTENIMGIWSWSGFIIENPNPVCPKMRDSLDRRNLTAEDSWLVAPQIDRQPKPQATLGQHAIFRIFELSPW